MHEPCCSCAHGHEKRQQEAGEEETGIRKHKWREDDDDPGCGAQRQPDQPGARPIYLGLLYIYPSLSLFLSLPASVCVCICVRSLECEFVRHPGFYFHPADSTSASQKLVGSAGKIPNVSHPKRERRRAWTRLNDGKSRMMETTAINETEEEKEMKRKMDTKRAPESDRNARVIDWFHARRALSQYRLDEFPDIY